MTNLQIDLSQDKNSVEISRKESYLLASFIVAITAMGAPLRSFFGNTQAEIFIFILGLSGIASLMMRQSWRRLGLVTGYLLISLLQEIILGNTVATNWLVLLANCAFLVVALNLQPLSIENKLPRYLIIGTLLASLLMAIIQKYYSSDLCYIKDCNLRPNGLARSTFQLSTIGLCCLMIALGAHWIEKMEALALGAIAIMIILVSGSLGAFLCGAGLLMFKYINIERKKFLNVMILFLIALVGITIQVNISDYIETFLSTGANSYRVFVYKQQLLSIIDNPFGVGIGTTGSISDNLHAAFRMDAESALLSYVNEQGLLGTIYIATIFRVLFRKFSQNKLGIFYISIILFLFAFQAFPKTPSTMLLILITVGLCLPSSRGRYNVAAQSGSTFNPS